MLAAALTLGCAGVARAETDVGLFAGALAGVHEGADNPSLSGLGAGALLEITQHWNGGRLHLEGIPRVTASGSGTAAFGRSTVALSILNATVSQDLDRHGRVRAGVGFQLINISNYNGNNGDRNYARVTSPRFEIAAKLPTAHNRFVGATLAVMPNVRGVLHAVDVTNTPEIDRPERGAEVDYALTYGWEGPRVTYVAGIRGLSYHTRNVITGGLVDRNVGGGLTFEAQFHLGR